VHKALTLLGFSTWTWSRTGQVLLLALAYFASAKLALALAIPPGYATPIWPASGIALAAMLAVGRPVWPGVWIGSLAANLSIEGSILSAFVIATGSAAQAALASAVIGRYVGVPYRFTEVEQVIKFVCLCMACAILAPLVALLPLALAHPLTGRDLFWNWWTWWQGDASGMLVATPFILSWMSRSPVIWDIRKVLEGVAFSFLLLGAAHMVFQGFGAGGTYSTTFIVVPFIVWAGFRFGQRGVTTATAAICGIALWYTLKRETGPFAGPVIHESLLLLLAFVCTLVVTGLVLCAVLDQLERAMSQLRGRQAELESHVRRRTQDLERANRQLEEDIAARKRTEQMLIESERRFRLMVDSVEEYAIFRLDTEGRVASWNAGAERINGYRDDEIIGEHFSRFYPQEDVERGKPAWELELVKREGRYQEEGWRVRKDGSQYWASVLITAVRDDTGQLLGFSKVTRDLTERNRADAELIRAKVAAEKASEAKSQFLANMSHELRTPLNSLLILARLLADNTTENLTPKQVQFAQTIYASGMDLLTLINDLLDLAKIESGAITSVHLAPARLQDLNEELERTFRQVAQDKHLGFGIAIDPDVPQTIRTDMARLKQILKNLLANAFKFTRKGEVRLKARLARSGWSPGHARLSSAPGVIAFSVVDTGIGIPKDKQSLIFEAFQQADGTTSRQYGGTGLGLSISREFTRLLGGEIRLESEAGKGSTFTLYLPLPPNEAG
jgi:PAS domain S-box-containing protein